MEWRSYCVGHGVHADKGFQWEKEICSDLFPCSSGERFFVLNDIFHYIEDDQIHPYSASLMGQSNLNSELTGSLPLTDPIPNYMMNGGVQARDYVLPSNIKENGGADKYPMPEQQLQPAPKAESVLEDNSREPTNGFHENTINPVQEVPPPIEELVEEPQNHTYASVLLAAKVWSASSATPGSSSDKNPATASDWQQVPQKNSQQSAVPQPHQSGSTPTANDSSAVEMGEEFSATDDRGEIKSVYVRNLAPTVSASEIEEEFKKFGLLTSEGVAIRKLKDTDVCYAFVEFEDIASIHSAIKVASVEIAGRQVYIEERRAHSSFTHGRRGRGRAGYQPDTSRGRFGARVYGRGVAQDGEREFNRTRGNGYYRQTR